MSSPIYSNKSRTTTPLANGAEFLAAGEQTSEVGVLISVFTDTTCTIRAEFSHDNENWDSGLTFQVAANFHEFQPLLAAGRWFRWRKRWGTYCTPDYHYQCGIYVHSNRTEPIKRSGIYYTRR